MKENKTKNKIPFQRFHLDFPTLFYLLSELKNVTKSTFWGKRPEHFNAIIFESRKENGSRRSLVSRYVPIKDVKYSISNGVSQQMNNRSTIIKQPAIPTVL
jgi:hypothetical protein